MLRFASLREAKRSEAERQKELSEALAKQSSCCALACLRASQKVGKAKAKKRSLPISVSEAKRSEEHRALRSPWGRREQRLEIRERRKIYRVLK